MNATPNMSLSFLGIGAILGVLILLVMIPVLLIGELSSKRKDRRE